MAQDRLTADPIISLEPGARSDTRARTSLPSSRQSTTDSWRATMADSSSVPSDHDKTRRNGQFMIGPFMFHEPCAAIQTGGQIRTPRHNAAPASNRHGATLRINPLA